MGEAVADVTKLALLDVLFDGIHWFLFGNLQSADIKRIGIGDGSSPPF